VDTPKPTYLPPVEAKKVPAPTKPATTKAPVTTKAPTKPATTKAPAPAPKVVKQDSAKEGYDYPAPENKLILPTETK
jgi:hypothetical protein